MRPVHRSAGSARPILFSTIVFFATLAVLALGCEAYLRRHMTRVLSRAAAELAPFSLGEPDVLVRHTPRGRRIVANAEVLIKNHYTSGRDVTLRTNALGFRGGDIAMPKADRFRILVLGDSITWANYLPEAETYVARIGAFLPETVAGRRVEVINAGMSDTGTREQLDLLEEVGLAVEPDIVLLGFYLNDSRPPFGFPAELGSPGWLRRHSAMADWLYRRLRLRRFIAARGIPRHYWKMAAQTDKWSLDRAHYLAMAKLAMCDWGAAWEEGSWAVVAEQMARLRRLSDQYGFQVGVVCMPVAFQVVLDFVEDAPQRRMQAVAAEFGFACLDMLPVYRRHRRRNLFFDHCHPRAWANDLMGRTIAGWLQRTLLANVAPRRFPPCRQDGAREAGGQVADVAGQAPLR